MYLILFIHLSADEHLGCFHCSAFINNVAVNDRIQVFVRTVFSFLLGLYPGVELLDHIRLFQPFRTHQIVHWITFKGTAGDKCKTEF